MLCITPVADYMSVMQVHHSLWRAQMAKKEDKKKEFELNFLKLIDNFNEFKDIFKGTI